MFWRLHLSETFSFLDYQFISNFEWYVSVLVELAQIDGSKHGSLIASQLMDVTIRVESIRSFSVRQMSLLLQNHHLLLSSQRGCSTDVLFAAAWICGEFSEHLGMIKPYTFSTLHGSIIAFRTVFYFVQYFIIQIKKIIRLRPKQLLKQCFVERQPSLCRAMFNQPTFKTE